MIKAHLTPKKLLTSVISIALLCQPTAMANEKTKSSSKNTEKVGHYIEKLSSSPTSSMTSEPPNNPNLPSRYRRKTDINSSSGSNNATKPNTIDIKVSSVPSPQITLPLNIINVELNLPKSTTSESKPQDATSLVNELNSIYKQFGIAWEPIPQENIKIQVEKYNKTKEFKDLPSFVSMISKDVAKKIPPETEGHKIYIINRFPEAISETAVPLNTTDSILVSTAVGDQQPAPSLILAHELAHKLGLSDIPSNNSNLMSVTRPKSAQGTKLYAPQTLTLRKNANALMTKLNNNLSTNPQEKESQSELQNNQQKPSIFGKDSYDSYY